MHAQQYCFAAFYHGLPATCDHSEQAGVADPRPEANSPQILTLLLASWNSSKFIIRYEYMDNDEYRQNDIMNSIGLQLPAIIVITHTTYQVLEKLF